MRPMKTMLGWLWSLSAAFLLAGCGGDAGPEAVPDTAALQATPGNYVHLQSDPGDYIGQGQAFSYTEEDAVISVTATGGHLTVSIRGDENWSGNFKVMDSLGQLQPGDYLDLQRYPFHDPAKGGLDWSGEGRGCNTLQGWFAVDKVIYAGDKLMAIDLRFEQHCEGGKPALHGQIHWESGESTSPPGPVNPPPAGLWEPAPGATPAQGNYVYLASEAGDYIGQGGTYVYTAADAVLAVSASGGRLGVSVNGNEQWSADFQAMDLLSQLQPGYYGDLQRYPFHNPAKGGLNWSGEGRGCNTLQGWFVVDSVTYVDGNLTAIDLRFEQRCEGGATALRGKIHWAPGDTTTPPGPVNPPPPGLWEPAPGATPATGNYVFLQSEPGDYIGLGQVYTYTPANASLAVSASGGRLTASVAGNEDWRADFQAMNSLSQLQPGYYGDLQRYPFHNPVKGGLDWSGDGRGCNTLQGWFVVDSVTYTGGSLTAIDLRFEQHCEGGVPALRGKIHWVAGDTTAPPGPVNPPPADLWQPGPGVVPATGNYVFLQSDPGDYIGQGRTNTYTPANTTLAVSASGGRLSVSVSAAQLWWSGTFQAMSTLSQLQPGYYGDLQRYPFHNPVKGGLNWSGQGRGCNTLQGWFVVDSVTYVNGRLVSIELRFEQHCEGRTPALRGKIRWAA